MRTRPTRSAVQLLALLPLIIAGCGKPAPAPGSTTKNNTSQGAPVTSKHDPATFRATLEALIAANKFGEATAYLELADPEAQAAHDGAGYLAVAGITIRLPGLEDEVGMYDPQRDWVIPGTSDVVEFPEWQRAAEEFATAYNRARQGG